MNRLLLSVTLAAMMPVTAFGAIVYSGSQNVVLQLSPMNSMSSTGIDIAEQGEKWDAFRVDLWLDGGAMSMMGMPGMVMGMPGTSMAAMTLQSHLAIYAPGAMSMSMGTPMGMSGIVGFLNRAMNLPMGAMIGPSAHFLDWAYLYDGGGIDDEGGYIGIMTPDGRYGWLRLMSQSGLDTSSPSAVFGSWAYESRPGVAVAAGEGPCDWFPGGSHKMHWPQTPDLSPAGLDLSDVGTVLADDFKCTASGPISRIHIWGSFADDVLPTAGVAGMTFEVSIYSHAPVGQNQPNRPGTPLWTRTFAPSQYSVRMVHDGPEGWCDPLRDTYQQDNHRQAYQYDFCADQNPFVQQEGTVYWLVVKVLDPANSVHKFGWKGTCPELRWNNDAVYLATDGSWRTLAYPSGHAYAGQSLDLAFVIDSGRDSVAKYDLGDAPDSSNSRGAEMTAYPKDGPPGVTAHFPTVYQAGSPPYGPLHRNPKGTAYLGYGVTLENEADIGPDAEPTNNLNPPADISDADGSDDGVIVPLVLPDSRATTFDYVVTVIDPHATHLYVNVWFDWNRDGDWDDTLTCPDGAEAPEWAVQNQELNLAGIGPHPATTPAFRSWHPIVVGDLDPVWMRITLSDSPWTSVLGAGGAGPVNGYPAGETEDYYFTPKNEAAPTTYDWGDAPDGKTVVGYPTLAAHSGARHALAGPWLGDEFGVPDAESDGQPDPNALGDDNDGNDDEDGVWIPPLVLGEPALLTLEVGGGGGIVQAWIDFNGDKSWQPGEQVLNGYLPDGLHTVSVFVPPDAAVGQSFARFRISSRGGLTADGPSPDGEVEDHDVSIRAAPPQLKRVQWPDLTADGIDIRVDNSDGKTRWLADDFKCTSTNRITEVRLWGSWKNDRKGKIQKISLTIHPDDPAGTAGADKQNRFSKPAPDVLWSKSFGPTEFTETSYHIVRDIGEWWWDPATGQLVAGGDTEVWQVDIPISTKDAFLQQGTPATPIIYWLQVQVETTDGQFGWKTRRWPDHYQDDAVWDVAADKPSAWKELRYPKDHPYYCVAQNSIDMAFSLTFTQEVVEYPTTRPGSVTQCPVVETQCPAVETRCPVVKTQCPMYATRCPTVRTKCPAVSTRCPLVATKCPVVKTKCPTTATRCPPVKTKCPAVTTRCPESLTKCPPTVTNCMAVDTQCPAVTTKCPVVTTQCSIAGVATQCPAVTTQCPAVSTQCPESSTKCPPTVTKCQTVDTKCPAVETKCPAVETKCPESATKCPAATTKCPESLTKCQPTATKCQTVDTECPAVETKCPAEKTKCPVVTTQCPVYQTKCPPTVTECQQVQTECPAVQTRCPEEKTKCPAVNTQCPVYQTKCPPTVSECQAVQTECPPVQTRCPEEKTKCPAVSTQCPVVQTKCPPTVTDCQAVQTECPAVQTQCPVVSTQCPTGATKCPEYATRCPEVSTKCPETATKCPPVQTQCPVVETQCPLQPTICVATPVQTQCPVVNTTCPTSQTKCPESATKCPAVSTKCPESATKCPAVSTQCPSVSTQCPPVDTKCPAPGTHCGPPCYMEAGRFKMIAVPCPALDVLCPTFVALKG